MWWVIWAIWFVYTVEMAKRLRGWFLLPENPSVINPDSKIKVTVIAAMRNEEIGLRQFLTGLATQTYPKALLEILLLDDHSSDNSVAVALALKTELDLSNLTLVNLSEIAHAQGKKAALTAGVNMATGTYILTTDADCQMGADWVTTMVNFAQQEEVVFVSGPVAYSGAKTLLEKLQVVEFAGLIGVGAASIALQSPNMCNGANLLFRKDAFQAVGGYSGNQGIASGDDEFLLHKIAVAFPGKYFFLKDNRAVVYTAAKPTLRELYEQRLRWASKSHAYTLFRPKLLALTVAAMQLVIVVAVVLGLTNVLSGLGVILLICLKFAVELLFFWPVLHFFGKHRLAWLVGLLQLVYPLFVLAVAIGSLSGKYTWKGRVIKPA